MVETPRRPNARRFAAPPRPPRITTASGPSTPIPSAASARDDIAQIDNLDAQVERLTRELTDARSENTELEKQVQTLEQSIVDTREEFLKIGHGGKNKHLAGSHENEIIADLEIQLKDKHYELEKTRQQKYKLYVKNNECNSAQADLDKSVAECKKNMIEYAERADRPREDGVLLRREGGRRVQAHDGYRKTRGGARRPRRSPRRRPRRQLAHRFAGVQARRLPRHP